MIKKMYPVVLIILLLVSVSASSSNNKNNHQAKPPRKRVKIQHSPSESPAPVPIVQSDSNASISTIRNHSTSSFASSNSSLSSLNGQLEHLNFMGLEEDIGLDLNCEGESIKMRAPTPIPSHQNVIEPLVPEVSEVSWDLEKESKVSFSPIEFQQFSEASFTEKFTSLASVPTSEKFTLFRNDRFDFSRNWPEEETATPPLNELGCRYQMLALKSILSPGHAQTFNNLLKLGLVDLTRPIYDSKHEVYRSFLSIILENDKIDQDKLDSLLRFVPKQILDKANSKGVTPLEVAVRKRDLTLISKLVVAGAEINAKAFMSAVKHNERNIVDYFLSTNRFDPNVIIQGTNHIEVALTNLGAEYVKRILATYNGQYKINPFTLMTLVNRLMIKKSPLIKTLAQISIDPCMKKNVQGPFTLAIRNAVILNDAELFRFFHFCGIPIDTVYPSSKVSGSKLIHFAAIAGHVEMIDLLLELGENVDRLTGSGFSVLETAMINKKYQMAAELIKRGAKIGLAQSIQTAIQCNELSIVEGLLLSTSEDLTNFILPNGYNLITFAISSDRPQILRSLLSSSRINLFQFDQFQQNIYNMTIPVEASEELVAIIEEETNNLKDLVDLA